MKLIQQDDFQILFLPEKLINAIARAKAEVRDKVSNLKFGAVMGITYECERLAKNYIRKLVQGMLGYEDYEIEITFDQINPATEEEVLELGSA